MHCGVYIVASFSCLKMYIACKSGYYLWLLTFVLFLIDLPVDSHETAEEDVKG